MEKFRSIGSREASHYAIATVQVNNDEILQEDHQKKGTDGEGAEAGS